MFSDFVITIAGRSFTITSHDIFMTAVSVVTGVIFWAALYFSRKRIVLLKRSSGTDQVSFELSRIADALERIANRPVDRAVAAAMRRQNHLQPLPLPRRESKNDTFSFFRR
jgi:hypothetical protein